MNALTPLPEIEAKPDFVLSTYIRCSHVALWDAITTGQMMAQHHFAGLPVEGDLRTEGDRMTLMSPAGPVVAHEAVRLDPRTLAVIALHPLWDKDVPVSHTAFRLTNLGSEMRLVMEHWGPGPCGGNAENGWTRFAASLKSWLETGERLHIPMSGEAQ